MSQTIILKGSENCKSGEQINEVYKNDVVFYVNRGSKLCCCLEHRWQAEYQQFYALVTKVSVVVAPLNHLKVRTFALQHIKQK